ncbi:hypothetical protein C7534_103138 [Pseudomonas sp. OV226]|nr:hypothetical protein C7534_103138 [Pseudomonas sp. OV226]
MNLRFEYIKSGDDRKPHYSSECNTALEQIKRGDPQTAHMYRALELLYQSLIGARTIVIRRPFFRIACLDFVEAYGELTQAPKDKRNSYNWIRAHNLAAQVAYLVRGGISTILVVESEPKPLPRSWKIGGGRP